jgi:hypothetical protein
MRAEQIMTCLYSLPVLANGNRRNAPYKQKNHTQSTLMNGKPQYLERAESNVEQQTLGAEIPSRSSMVHTTTQTCIKVSQFMKNEIIITTSETYSFMPSALIKQNKLHGLSP